jgi:hypothetical protein
LHDSALCRISTKSLVLYPIIVADWANCMGTAAFS